MIGMIARIVIGLVGGLLLVFAMSCALFGELIRDVATRRRPPTQFRRNRLYAVESYETSVTEVQ
jgi:uncharacterized membrane protein YeiH